MLEFTEEPGRLEVRSPMRTGTRVVFALLALVPLAAPYELLIRVRWESLAHPFFLIALAISLGATALSAFLLFTALAGLSSRMVFDVGRDEFRYSASSPVIRLQDRVYPIGAITGIEVESREWSDGGPTFHVRVVLSDGAVFETASSWTRDEIEAARDRIVEFLAMAQPSAML